MKLFDMDIGRVVQSSRAMTTWRPVSAIPKVDRFKFDTLLGSDFPRGSFQTWMSRPVSGRGNFSIRLQSFQLSRNARPGGNHKMSRLLIAPVVNAVRPGSEETPATELKSQLEALQLEASQVRDRCKCPPDLWLSRRSKFLMFTKLVSLRIRRKVDQAIIFSLSIGRCFQWKQRGQVSSPAS